MTRSVVGSNAVTVALRGSLGMSANSPPSRRVAEPSPNPRDTPGHGGQGKTFSDLTLQCRT